jgi:hypothetical protein
MTSRLVAAHLHTTAVDKLAGGNDILKHHTDLARLVNADSIALPLHLQGKNKHHQQSHHFRYLHLHITITMPSIHVVNSFHSL